MRAMKRGKQRGGGRQNARKQKKQKQRAERIRCAKAAEREGVSLRLDEFDDLAEPEDRLDPSRLDRELAVERLLRRHIDDDADEPREVALEPAERVAEALANDASSQPTDDVERAQDLAFFALDAFDDRYHNTARKYALAALELDPGCCDALWIRAVLVERTPEAVVQRLESVLRGEEERIGLVRFERDLGRFWKQVHRRPYLRALNALASAARAAKRREDSFAATERLLELAPEDPLAKCVPLLADYLRLGRASEARALAKRRREDRSAGMRWARVLLHLVAGQNGRAERALAPARRANRHAELYFRGEREVPSDPPGFVTPKRPSEGELLAYWLAKAWRAHPAAVEWLRAQPPPAPRKQKERDSLDLGPAGEGWCLRRQLGWWDRAKSRFLARLVLEGSALAPGEHASLELRCRQRPDRRPCRGELHATRSEAGDALEWRCTRCEASGRVTRWSATFLGGVRAMQSAPDAIEFELSANVRQLLLEREDLYARSWALLRVARDEGDAWKLRARAADLEALYGCVAESLLHEPASFFTKLERRLRAALGRTGEPTLAERNDEALLHRAVQARDAHSPPTSPRVLLRAEIEGVLPPIRRELALPAHASLEQLHFVLQLAFGWSDAHPHAFETRGRRFGSHSDRLRDATLLDERGVRLCADELRPGASSRYTYGRNEAWRLSLTVLAVGEEAPLAIELTAAERPAPPDDSNGPEELAALLAAGDPRLAPEALDLSRRIHLVSALAPRFWNRSTASTDA